MPGDAAPAVEVVDLVKHYRVGTGVAGRGSVVHAVEGVSFALRQGEVLGLVGESGSGKSTIAKCILRLIEPTAGTIRLRGTDITHLSRRLLRPLRRELHIVFQDPFSSLNPRMTCGDIVGEPLRLHRLPTRSVSLAVSISSGLALGGLIERLPLWGIALAALLWRVLPVSDGRSWLAWAGVMFSAGADY